MKCNMTKLMYGTMCVAVALLLAACGGHVGSSPSISVDPQEATVLSGSTLGFRAYRASALASGVKWTSSGCAIDQSGLFTASCPAGTYTVSASLSGVTGSATVRVAQAGTPAAAYLTASQACAAMPVRSSGTTYYFCDCLAGAQSGCVTGNDNVAASENSCTDPAMPCQSLSRAQTRFNAMAAGSTIAFCKGGAFAGGLSLANASCRSATDMGAPANTSTCDIRDYAPSWGGTARPIIAAGGSAIDFSSSSKSTQGVRILNLDLEGGGNTASAIFTYGQNTYFYSCNNVINAFGLGYQDQPNGNLEPSNHTFIGNYVTNNGSQGMLARGHNLRIDSNFFDNNGSTNNRDHTLYISGINNPPALNGSVVNNEIRYTKGGCLGNPFIIHANWDGFLIENNIIDTGQNPGPGCWNLAVQVDSGFPNSAFRNVIIRRNLFTGNGNHQVIADGCPGLVYENNINDVHDMYVSEGAVVIPFSAASGGAPVSNNLAIRNNTIYFSGAASSGSSIGINVGNEGTGHVIANNAVYFTGTAGRCFHTPLSSNAYTFVGNDACNGTWDTGYDTTTHVTDPLFVNGLDNLRPQPTSLLVAGGNATYAPTTDFVLKTRPNPPSIGAYEP